MKNHLLVALWCLSFLMSGCEKNSRDRPKTATSIERTTEQIPHAQTSTLSEEQQYEIEVDQKEKRFASTQPRLTFNVTVRAKDGESAPVFVTGYLKEGAVNIDSANSHLRDQLENREFHYDFSFANPVKKGIYLFVADVTGRKKNANELGKTFESIPLSFVIE